MISAQSTPTNNGVQSIYFVGEGQGNCNISTHSRPKAAAGSFPDPLTSLKVSTHSRPKAAAIVDSLPTAYLSCFNTQPPEGGCANCFFEREPVNTFQHTAARRRLPVALSDVYGKLKVSTHSRPKAAAHEPLQRRQYEDVSTHSRPKAAANVHLGEIVYFVTFQHTAARRRLQHIDRPMVSS